MNIWTSPSLSAATLQCVFSCWLILWCFRSHLSFQTPTRRRNLGETQVSGKRARQSATVNPESPDSLASQDRRYRLTSSHHSPSCFLGVMRKHRITFTVSWFTENITVSGLKKALLLSNKQFSKFFYCFHPGLLMDTIYLYMYIQTDRKPFREKVCICLIESILVFNISDVRTADKPLLLRIFTLK